MSPATSRPLPGTSFLSELGDEVHVLVKRISGTPQLGASKNVAIGLDC